MLGDLRKCQYDPGPGLWHYPRTCAINSAKLGSPTGLLGAEFAGVASGAIAAGAVRTIEA